MVLSEGVEGKPSHKLLCSSVYCSLFNDALSLLGQLKLSMALIDYTLMYRANPPTE
jgi:hypothetical protein